MIGTRLRLKQTLMVKLEITLSLSLHLSPKYFAIERLTIDQMNGVIMSITRTNITMIKYTY